jgi:hypothetical protein
MSEEVISDGFHTMDELYEHRHALFCALTAQIFAANAKEIDKKKHLTGFKSWRHSDRAMAYEGWFLAGLNLPTGQISYHLPAQYWTLCYLPQYDIPPAWDGHTAPDVVNRLKLWID